jgi:protein DGCR14
MELLITFYIIAQARDTSQAINFYVEDEPTIEKRVNLNLSLDQFQTLYTR